MSGQTNATAATVTSARAGSGHLGGAASSASAFTTALSAVPLVVPSAMMIARMRVAGFSCGVMTCRGRQPVLYGAGDVHIGSHFAVRATQARVELGALAGGRLVIGDDVFVNTGASIVANISITIGDGARIGDFAALYDSDFHPVDEVTAVRAAPVSLGVNVWVGRGALVLPGVSVGDHAVVAAGSVVTTDVPARTLVAGSPARVVRELVAADAWRRP